jgi:hypothetical protein
MKIKGDFSKIKAASEKAKKVPKKNKKNCCFRSGIFFSLTRATNQLFSSSMKNLFVNKPPVNSVTDALYHISASIFQEKRSESFLIQHEPLGHNNPSHFQLVNFQLNLSP